MSVVRDVFSMWVVYRKPKDYPHSYVARRFEIRAGGVNVPTEDLRIAATLADIQGQLPRGLYRLNRNPNDEPHIVEVWL